MTFREVMKKLGVWSSAKRETYKELSKLSDKELEDIGLTRGTIIDLINEMEG